MDVRKAFVCALVHILCSILTGAIQPRDDQFCEQVAQTKVYCSSLKLHFEIGNKFELWQDIKSGHKITSMGAI